MANLTVEVTGIDNIDNAGIYLNDPNEKLCYFLDPVSDKDWKSTGLIKVPMHDDVPLSCSLHIAAYTGTKFSCTITNKDNDKTITFSGVTGTTQSNRATVKGSAVFK